MCSNGIHQIAYSDATPSRITIRSCGRRPNALPAQLYTRFLSRGKSPMFCFAASAAASAVVATVFVVDAQFLPLHEHSMNCAMHFRLCTHSMIAISVVFMLTVRLFTLVEETV